MEIRSTSADDPNSSPQRIDITRKAREAIQTRQPLNQEPEISRSPRDPVAAAKAVQDAREQHREQHQERIANARVHYTANHAEAFAKNVTAARDVYDARNEAAVDRREKRAGVHHEAAGASDKVELSKHSQRLSQLDLAPTADDKARAERVAELKRLHERGQLNTDELIARTAHRLLGGD